MEFAMWVMIGWVVMAAVMTGLWFAQRRWGDPGIVDVVWGLGVAGLGTLFASVSAAGDPARRITLVILIWLWALRLSGYILRRLLTLPEDGRYQSLQEMWGSSAPRRMFWFYQMQAFGSLLFAIPLFLAAGNPEPFGLFDWIGVVIWMVALAGESVSDWQLAQFRRRPENRGQVCQSGLWRYSRHPNYFFEWLHWWSYVALAVAAPWGWITLLGPGAMLHFILNVTGIPPTEAQAIKSRGELYREYQRTTSRFFPWPPHSTSERGT